MDKRFGSKVALALLVMAVALTMVVSGCTSPSTPSNNTTTGNTTVTPVPTTVPSDTIVVMEAGAPVSMDYQTDDAYDTASEEPTQQVYETLFYFNGSDVTTPVPVLATGYDLSADGLTYTIYLRPNVTFHDGTAFNASAVKYSLDRMLLLDNGQAYSNFVGTVKGFAAYNDHLANTTQADIDAYQAAGGIKVLNDTAVQITLESPNSNFIRMLTFSATSIMSPTFDMAHGGINATGHVGNAYLHDHEAGTGPFILQSWQDGQGYTLVRNDNYWRTPAKTAKVVMQVVSDWNTRLLALEKGDADFINVDSLHAPDVKNQSGVTLANFGGLYVTPIQFNQAMWPYNDIRVRKAFTELFNKSLYVDTAMNGYGTIRDGSLPVGLVGGDLQITPQPYNTTDAKQLLIAAGFTPANKTTLTIDYNKGNTNRQRAAQMLADAINALTPDTGLTMQVQEVDWHKEIPLINQGKIPIYIVGWQADYPGSDNFISAFDYSKGYYMTLNSNPGNATADALFQQSLKETDPAKQAALYKQIIEIDNSLYSYTWLYQGQDLVGYGNDLKGVAFNPLNGGVYVNFYTTYK